MQDSRLPGNCPSIIPANCQMKRSFCLCVLTLEQHLVTRQQNLLSVGGLSVLQDGWLAWVRVAHGESLQALHTLWTRTGQLKRAVGWKRNCRGADKTVMNVLWYNYAIPYYNCALKIKNCMAYATICFISVAKYIGSCHMMHSVPHKMHCIQIICWLGLLYWPVLVW